MNRCHIVRMQGKGREGFERERLRQSKRRNLKIDQIQVKFYQLFATVIRWSLWKFEKKLPNLSFDWRERGRKEEKRAVLQRNSQKVTKIWNLSDFQQIQVKFYQLFATVIRWSLWKFEKKITKFIVRLTRERKKGRKSHTLAEIAKKLKKSNALYIKKPE